MMMSWNRAYIGLGSNLEEPLHQLKRALIALQQLPNTRNVTISPLYRSSPVGPAGQPDYINAVAMFDTQLSPFELLSQLQTIETSQGRVRLERWGPRTLDLDILLFGDQVIAEAKLTIPHPYLTQRNFALYPLADIAPQLQFPDGVWLRDLVTLCSSDGLEKLPLTIEEV